MAVHAKVLQKHQVNGTRSGAGTSDHVPPANQLDDEARPEIAWVPERMEARMHALALKQSAGTLTADEQLEYAALVEQAQVQMVENARSLSRQQGAAAFDEAHAAERPALRAAHRAAHRPGSA